MNPTSPASSFPVFAPSRLRRWVALWAGLLLGACAVGAADSPRRVFDIPAGSAETTLQTFSKQAAGQFIFSAGKVGDVATQAVKGEFTAREALDRMLANTSLYAVQDERTGALTVGRGAPGATAPAGPGTIVGRVFNPATGEYVRNAQVRIVESGDSTVSEDEGAYRLSPVPAGRVTLEVTYTGYRSVTATVDVTAGGTVTKNFELISTLQDPATAPKAAADGTVVLQAFTVAGEREGNAKAIMDQRNSMNITNTVASDAFGDNAEGNVGEFLKHLPGVELDLFYGEVRTVRLGGLGSEYTSVTMDGIALASTDANNSGSGAARSFTMEMASLNSMESIEVNKTVSADVDANAPAGTINLRTKRAFDRVGRRVSWQANVVAHSEAFKLGRSLGPDEDQRNYKIRPGGIFEYSDRFLDNNLGLVLNLSESNVYQEALITSVAYSTATTAADQRPLIPSTLNFQWAPRFNKRFATTLTTDYKFSPSFNVGLGVVYNYVDLWTPQRTVIFNAGTRTAVVGADPLLSFTSAANGTVQVNPVAVSKMGETFTLIPRAEFKRGNFELEAKGAYSDSTSWYDPLGRRNSIRDTNSPTASGVTFRASRSDLLSNDWHFTQTAGPDIANGASYTSPSITANDGRFGRTVLFSGEIIGTLKTSKWLPVIWKSGIKTRQQIQKFEDDQLARRFDYAPNGTTVANGAWANYRSPWEYSLGMNDGSIASISGGNVFMPNLRDIADLYRSNPAAFRQNWGANADNYYESYVARRRRYYERIDAGYLMGTTKFKGATLRAGLRWEDTHTEASEADTRSPAEMRAAGFGSQVNTNGRATTIPAIDYQFLSRPRVKRTGEYDNLFPSASFKYNLIRNLDFHFGYSATIRRPSYVNLSGVWVIDDTPNAVGALPTVTAPNPRLKPETSDNYAARLAYYFEPVGQLAATFTERSVKNILITDRLTAQEFGYTIQDELQNYEFITTNNGPEVIKIRSMELEYNQSLSFLGPLFRRLSVRGSYTRLYAEIPRANLTPHLASGGLNYTFRKLNLYTNWNWSDDVNTNVSGTTYRRHRANVDAGGGWRFNNTYILSVSVRNLTDTPYVNMQRFVTGPTAITRNETVGQSWTFAIKGTY
ncbi:MAG: TonB-dependent receptor [Verrucomicrobia bacterium]|nr:TonB-dependent receptor [Verrucomicrobiota bacterium]